jgi:hypothetical protein
MCFYLNLKLGINSYYATIADIDKGVASVCFVNTPKRENVRSLGDGNY